MRGVWRHLSQRLRLLHVAPSQSDPAPAPVGVVHLLSGDPGFGPAVGGDGEAVLPAWGGGYRGRAVSFGNRESVLPQAGINRQQSLAHVTFSQH